MARSSIRNYIRFNLTWPTRKLGELFVFDFTYYIFAQVKLLLAYLTIVKVRWANACAYIRGGTHPGRIRARAIWLSFCFVSHALVQTSFCLILSLFLSRRLFLPIPSSVFGPFPCFLGQRYPLADLTTQIPRMFFWHSNSPQTTFPRRSDAFLFECASPEECCVCHAMLHLYNLSSLWESPFVGNFGYNSGRLKVNTVPKVMKPLVSYEGRP